MTTLVVLLLLINLQRHCFSSMLSYLHPVNKVTEARREVCRGYRSFKMSSDLTCPMSTLLNHPQIKLRFSRAFRVWNLIGSTTQGYFAGTLKDHTFFFSSRVAKLDGSSSFIDFSIDYGMEGNTIM